MSFTAPLLSSPSAPVAAPAFAPSRSADAPGVDSAPAESTPPSRDTRAGVAPTLQLPADGQSVTLSLRRPTRLRVLSGRVWITQVGRPEDHWLLPGESLVCHPTGRWRGTRWVVSGTGPMAGETPVTLKVEPMV